jgi:NitT/TauT family transport system permease protein
VQWGDKHYAAQGLGAYIAQMTEAGDFAHIVLGIGAMSFIVVIFNKGFWRPMYNLAAKKLRFD